MFQNLSDKLEAAFKKFKNKGKLTESDVKEGMQIGRASCRERV